jgi:hypothetical protein
MSSKPVGTSPEPPKPANLGANVGGVVGAVIGIGASRYFGALLLVPGLAMILGAVLLGKLAPARVKPMIAAASVQFGHLCWLLVGALILGVFKPVAIDIVVLGAGLVWLVARPGIAPALLLGLYQVVGLGLNVVQLAGASEAELTALLLHVVLRVGAIALLAVGLVSMRRSAAQAPQASPASQASPAVQ